MGNCGILKTAATRTKHSWAVLEATGSPERRMMNGPAADRRCTVTCQHRVGHSTLPGKIKKQREANQATPNIPQVIPARVWRESGLSSNRLGTTRRIQHPTTLSGRSTQGISLEALLVHMRLALSWLRPLRSVQNRVPAGALAQKIEVTTANGIKRRFPARALTFLRKFFDHLPPSWHGAP